MRVVFDTNVIVSATLTPAGVPGRLLDLTAERVLIPVLSSLVLAEYREVLMRPRFGLDSEAIHRLLDAFESLSLMVTPLPWICRLPDPDDEMFLATAHAGVATLVTGNLRHFPKPARGDVRVMTPRECLGDIEHQGAT